MDILVVGANGRTGRHILPLLLALGHNTNAMIRDINQREEIESIGANVVLGDLESQLDEIVKGNHGIIFAAGSGSKTGPEKTIDVDQNSAISLIDTCERVGCLRFVMLSSLDADNPESGPEKLRHYLRAKSIADMHLAKSKLDWTIVRPGFLTGDHGTGLISLSPNLGNITDGGSISRMDVAEVLVSCLSQNQSIGKSFDILEGNSPIEEALGKL